MVELTPQATFLMLFVVAGFEIFVVAWILYFRNTVATPRLDAAFQVFSGFFMVCVFAYTAMQGLIDGEMWVATKAAVPVRISEDDRPGAYWVLEAIGALVAFIGVAMMAAGIHRFRASLASSPTS